VSRGRRDHRRGHRRRDGGDARRCRGRAGCPHRGRAQVVEVGLGGADGSRCGSARGVAFGFGLVVFVVGVVVGAAVLAAFAGIVLATGFIRTATTTTAATAAATAAGTFGGVGRVGARCFVVEAFDHLAVFVHGGGIGHFAFDQLTAAGGGLGGQAGGAGFTTLGFALLVFRALDFAALGFLLQVFLAALLALNAALLVLLLLLFGALGLGGFRRLRLGRLALRLAVALRGLFATLGARAALAALTAAAARTAVATTATAVTVAAAFAAAVAVGTLWARRLGRCGRGLRRRLTGKERRDASEQARLGGRRTVGEHRRGCSGFHFHFFVAHRRPGWCGGSWACCLLRRFRCRAGARC